MQLLKLAAFALIPQFVVTGGPTQQIAGQDIDKILERADKLLEEAKGSYEIARTKNSVEAFVEAGFKLEEARIKYFVLQEIGAPEKQKIAADRLRAVNQLGKLIHDGKVAIMGGPVESPPTKPVDVQPDSPGKEPPSNPPASPARSPVDVTKRAPIPEAAKQREAEKLVRDLFKDQYAKKTPADKKVLAKLLMDQATKSRDDLEALWILYREAQDAAIQGCDVKMTLDVIEAMARIFDVDALSLKNSALSAIGKTAKLPDEFAALAQALLKLVEEFFRVDQFDAADKAIAIALQHARKSNDAALATRAATRVKEVAEAKTLFQTMKGVMETLAKNPDDPGANLEIGRFLCFVKGTWDLGLRFMAKGSDASLKNLAEKELALPTQAADLAAIGDGWYDLAEKEKSPLRKSQLLAHARSVYESALPDASSLVRAKLEKRLEALKASSPAASGTSGTVIDLLKMVDPKRDSVAGDWKIEDGKLVSAAGKFVRLEIPYQPPLEYDFRITYSRVSGANNVSQILNRQGKTFLWIMEFAASRCAFAKCRGKFITDASNPTITQVEYSQNDDGPHTSLIEVRKDRVRAVLNGKLVQEWKTDYADLSMEDAWKLRSEQALGLGCWESQTVFQRIELVEVTGKGKKLR